MAKSAVFKRVTESLGVEVVPHMPAGSDGRRTTARAKGKVERPFRTVKDAHETLYHFHQPETEEDANRWLARFVATYNTSTWSVMMPNTQTAPDSNSVSTSDVNRRRLALFAGVLLIMVSAVVAYVVYKYVSERTVKDFNVYEAGMVAIAILVSLISLAILVSLISLITGIMRVWVSASSNLAEHAQLSGRDLPKEVVERWQDWRKLFKFWRYFYWSTGTLGAIVSALAATPLGQQTPYLAVMASVCFAVLAFTHPERNYF